MKYCILIHISRDKISFSYNREDGDNRFVPYGDEPEKPLAICYQGNDIQIGSFALQEAMHRKPNAYKDIFDTIQNSETIEFRGEKCDINKLLFFAIERYLAEFFDKILLRQEGALIGNRANLPIALIFDPDLKDYERGYVKSSLINGGYGHVEEEDYNINISKAFKKGIISNSQASIFVAGNGIDLYCQVLGENIKSEIKMKGVGKDPRLNKAVNSILKDVIYQGYDQFHSQKDYDLEIISKVVSDFLLSNNKEKEGSFQLSDGNSYSYFLSISELYGSGSNISEDCVRGFSDLKTTLDNVGIEKTRCPVFLVDKESSNEYIESLFIKESFSVFKLTEKDREKAKLLILADIKKREYNIGSNLKKISVNTDISEEANRLFFFGKFKEAKEKYRTLLGDYSEEIKLCNQCLRDERMLKVVNINVNDVDEIFKRWNSYGISRELIESYQIHMGVDSSSKNRNNILSDTTKPIESRDEKEEDNIPIGVDKKAYHLFISGKFEEAKDMYQSLDGNFSKEISACIKCLRNMKELKLANDNTTRIILGEWKKLGILQEVIDKYDNKKSSSLTGNTNAVSKSINQKEQRQKIADARQLILKEDKRGLELLNQLEKRLHFDNFYGLDDKINEARNLWKDKVYVDKKQNTTSNGVNGTGKRIIQKVSVVNVGKPVKQKNINPISEREIRIRKAEALAQIRTGDIAKGRMNLTKLMDILESMDFHKYDEELSEALKKCER